ILIGIGTGGIKPCVAAFGGDQFHLPRQEDLLKQFFSVFYFAICFGGLLGMFVIPALRRTVTCFNEDSCYALGFGFSAGLMFLALFFFLGGKPMYRIKEPREDVMAEFIKCASVRVHIIYCFTLTVDSTALDLDSNPDFHVIGSPIRCEGDPLDDVTTKVGLTMDVSGVTDGQQVSRYVADAGPDPSGEPCDGIDLDPSVRQ
ncbi:unnamed protein product, partial [Timema podura]|nr:unnamed protein product [Timema podura]